MSSINSIRNSINSYEFHGKPFLSTIAISFVAIFLEQQALKWAQKRTKRTILPLKGNLKANLLTATLSTATCAATFYKLKPIREKPKKFEKFEELYPDLRSEIFQYFTPQDARVLRLVSKKHEALINQNKELRVAILVAQAKEYAGQTSWKDLGRNLFFSGKTPKEQKTQDEILQPLAEMTAYENVDEAINISEIIKNPNIKSETVAAIVKVVAHFNTDAAEALSQRIVDPVIKNWALFSVVEVLAEKNTLKAEKLAKTIALPQIKKSAYLRIVEILLQNGILEEAKKFTESITDSPTKDEASTKVIRVLREQNLIDAIAIKNSIQNPYFKGVAIAYIEAKTKPFNINFPESQAYAQSLQNTNDKDQLLRLVALSQSCRKCYDNAKHTADLISKQEEKCNTHVDIIKDIAEENPEQAINKVELWITHEVTALQELFQRNAYYSICEEIKQNDLDLLDTMLTKFEYPDSADFFRSKCIKQFLLYKNIEKAKEFRKKISCKYLQESILNNILSAITEVAKTDETRAKEIVTKMLETQFQKALGILAIAKGISDK